MGTKTSQDAVIVDALASGCSYRKAASIAGVGVTTVSRRMLKDDFRERVNERRGRILSESSGRLTASTRAAVSTLRKLLKSGSDGVRLGAAREILSATMALRQFTELEARIATLEKGKANESN